MEHNDCLIALSLEVLVLLNTYNFISLPFPSHIRLHMTLHMTQLIPLPLTVSCSRKSRLVLVLPFWYWLTRVVPDKIQRAIKWL